MTVERRQKSPAHAFLPRRVFVLLFFYKFDHPVRRMQGSAFEGQLELRGFGEGTARPQWAAGPSRFRFSTFCTRETVRPGQADLGKYRPGRKPERLVHVSGITFTTLAETRRPWPVRRQLRLTKLVPIA